MRSFIAWFIVALSVIPGAAAADSEAKERLAVELMNMLGFHDTLNQITEAMIPHMEDQVRLAHPEITEEQVAVVRDVVVEELKALEAPLMSMTMHIMLKYYDENDLHVLLEFYKTPTGQKAIRAMPSLSQEIVTLSQSLVTERLPGMQKKLRERLQALGTH